MEFLMTRSVCAAIGVVLFAAVASAQSPAPSSPTPDSPFFNIVKLADGVYDAIGLAGARANAQFIVNSDHVVVVDTTTRPVWARELIRQIKKITPLPVRYVVYTHWHIDHVGGAQSFLEAYPGVQFIGQRYAYKDQIQVGYQRKGEYLSRGSTNAMNALEQQLRDGKDRTGKALDAAMRADVEKQLAEQRTYLAENAEIRDILPTVVYDDSLVLRDRLHDIEILYLGIGHTRGDSFVYLPKEKMIMTGDAFGMGLPGGHDGYPREWQTALERLYHLNWNTVVPAHFPPFTGKAQLLKAIDYLNDMNIAVQEAVDKGLSLEETRRTVTLTSHAKDFPGFAAANSLVVARAWAVLTRQSKSVNGEPILREE